MSLVDADGSYSDGDWSATPTAIERANAVTRSARDAADRARRVNAELQSSRVSDSGLNRAVNVPRGGESRHGAH